MHLETSHPLLFVDESRICSELDPVPVLTSIWSVCHKVPNVVQNGQRMANLSWRAWSQQNLMERTRARRHSNNRNVPSMPSLFTEAPALSTSVDSAASIDSNPAPFPTCADAPASAPVEPATSNLGIVLPTEKEVSTDTIQSLVTTIKNCQQLEGPLSPLPSPPTQSRLSAAHSPDTEPSETTPRPASPRNVPSGSSVSTSKSSAVGEPRLSPTESGTSKGSEASDHSIIRGFKPGDKSGISSYRSQSQLAPSAPTPILKSSSNHVGTPAKKKAAMFQIGSGESSVGSTMQEQVSPRSVRGRTGSSLKRPALSKKQTSFKDEVTEIKPKKATFDFGGDDDGAAIESDSEDESAIDDEAAGSAIEDDDDAWEDEGDAEPEDQPKELTFRRIPSKPELVSRRSMLAEGLHQSDRSRGLLASAQSTGNLRRSRTSTPNGPSIAASPNGHDEQKQTLAAIPRGPGQPMGGSHPPCPPLDPRQTRQSMLTQELGPELRMNMLNERKQRNFFTTSDEGGPRRAHTSVDMRSLAARAGQMDLNAPAQEQRPVRPLPKLSNEYFENHATDYHRTGW